MSPLRLLAALALIAGCYPPPVSPDSPYPGPMVAVGPPGGAMDQPPQASYYDPNQPGYPSGYPDGYQDGYPAGYPAGTEDVAAMQTDGSVMPSEDPSAAGYVMGAPTDDEIDVTLDGYGEWSYVDGYGEVWRPDATAVGVDFTPYDSCGTWVWTDWGWTFACDYNWGWLPFHYGRWGWFGDYWGWQPGYDWSPGWVDWRSGGDTCGWRPSSPTPVSSGVGGVAMGGGPEVRDHRHHKGHWAATDGKPPVLMDSHWRFQKQTDFGKRIRPNLMASPAEGLRLTSLVTRPPMHATSRPLAAASLMSGRLAARNAAFAGRRNGPRSVQQQPPAFHGDRYGGVRFDRPRPAPGYDRRDQSPSPAAIDRMWPGRPAPASTTGTQSTWTPRPEATGARGAAQPTAAPPRGAQPAWGQGRAPQPTWTPPPRGAQPTWTPPSRGSQPTWSPPRAPSSSGSPPSRSPSSSGSSWSPPSRSPSSSAGGGSPSRSSGSSGSSGSHSSGGGWGGGGSRSSGGGRHR